MLNLACIKYESIETFIKLIFHCSIRIYFCQYRLNVLYVIKNKTHHERQVLFFYLLVIVQLRYEGDATVQDAEVIFIWEGEEWIDVKLFDFWEISHEL